MQKARKTLSFLIHELNTWAGQERSTLEIARRLSRRWPVEIYSYSLDDPSLPANWGQVKFHRIRPHVRHPMALRSTHYFWATLPLAARRGSLLHATGACSLVSNVVQVQFVQKAWKLRRLSLPENMRLPPRALGSSRIRRLALKSYYDLLLNYHIAAERLAFRPGKTYIAISRSIASELRDLYGLTENVHVVHHGVDSREFRPHDLADPRDAEERARLRAELGLGHDDLVIAFIGAYDRKGLGVAIDALARVVPQLPETLRRGVRLLAVGEGDPSRYRARAEALGIGDNVILRGHVKNVAPFYRAADLFLFPTFYEPFGLVILEAMASGLAPVVSRSAGASELIEDGKSGLLIEDPRDAEEVSRLLARLITSPDLRASMSREARLRAESRDWDQVASEYERILAPFMQASPSNPAEKTL